MKAVLFILLIIIVIIGILIHISCQNVEGYLSGIGSLASIVGIAIAIIQIIQLKGKTEAVDTAVNHLKTEVFKFTTYADINTDATLIDEIESYARNSEVMPTLIKLKLLKDDMVKLKGYLKCKDFENYVPNDLNRHITNLGICILPLSSHDKNQPIDWDVIIKYLEEIKNWLGYMAGSLKGDKI